MPLYMHGYTFKAELISYRDRPAKIEGPVSGATLAYAAPSPMGPNFFQETFFSQAGGLKMLANHAGGTALKAASTFPPQAIASGVLS